MPPRTLLIDSGARGYVCRACQSTLRKRTTPAPLVSRRYSSQSEQQKNPSINEEEEERRKTLAALGLGSGKPGASTFNFFEKDRAGNLRQILDQDEFSKSFHGGDDEALNAQLKELEDSLREEKKYLTGLKKIWDENDIEDLMDRVDPPTDLVSERRNPSRASLTLIPTDGLKVPKRKPVEQLNGSLQRAARHIDRGPVRAFTISSLWKDYTKARPTLASSWSSVPSSAWSILWDVFSADVEYNESRMSHIYILSRDMAAANINLSPAQQLLAIEAMFIEGWQKEAIQNHTRFSTVLSADPETRMEFWQLGLRMHCLAGDLQRAETAIKEILNTPGDKDPRVLMPYIRACAQNPSTVELGFNSFRNLRSLLGESMTIQDYDDVISCFLSANQTEYALYVFVEMMTAGAVDLRSCSKFPPSVANPFFLGKWLKRLIGNGDLDGAYQVLLHMKGKGVFPRPIHVNGLIGAWLRSDTADSVGKAEDVAWTMINTRIQFVRTRNGSGLDPNIRFKLSGDGWPRATLETFSLLAESYVRRGLPAKMEELWGTFRVAEIAPDVFMLNQLLLSYLKAGHGELVPGVYQELSERHGIVPDNQTLAALWKALPINRLYTVRRRDYATHRPEGRALLAKMVKNAAVLRQNELDYSLGRTILHSFRKVDDKVGHLLALRVLRGIFSFEPPEPLILELLADTVDLQKMMQHPRARHRLIHYGERMEAYLKQRHQELVESGELLASSSSSLEEEEDGGGGGGSGDEKRDNKPQLLPPEVKRRELGGFLEIYLQNNCETSNLYPEGLEAAMEKAAADMGLLGGGGGGGGVES